MTALIDRAETAGIAGLTPSAVNQQRLQSLLRHITTSSNPEVTTTIAPMTGEKIIDLPLSNDSAADTAFAIARQAQKQWNTTSLQHRARVLLRFHDLVLNRRDEGLDIVQLETGKARFHAVEELLDTAITARYYARVGPGALKPKSRPGAFPVLTSGFEVFHPLGVVGVISPWNYPLTLAVGDAIAALMAGNGVVIKPDIQTTLSALWAIDLLYEAGLPEGLFGVITGEGAEVGPMITERGDFIMFTGSTAVGRTVASRAGERLVGCSMELGGKNAMIVCDDANISKAAEIAERASFSNSGQLCISMERIYVHRSILNQFTDAFVARTEKMKQVAEIGWGADVGSLISQKQLDTVTAHVNDAVSKGAKVLAGGKARPDIGPFFYEPTILTDTDDSMVCFGHETFGPLVSIYPFDTEDEAIALVNDTEYGLNSSVITADVKRGQAIAVRLESGTVNVNEGYATAWSTYSSSMGGFKTSGIGRRHGIDGLMKYTESQTIGTQRIMGWGGPPVISKKQWTDTLVVLVKGLKLIGKK